jgi:hypothetical protein
MVQRGFMRRGAEELQQDFRQERSAPRAEPAPQAPSSDQKGKAEKSHGRTDPQGLRPIVQTLVGNQ